jgi:hypothetical protein
MTGRNKYSPQPPSSGGTEKGATPSVPMSIPGRRVRLGRILLISFAGGTGLGFLITLIYVLWR